MKKFVVLLSMALLITMFPSISFSQTETGTEVGGMLDTSSTWTIENSPYIITETIQIPEGVTLTIDPGVTVMRPSDGLMFLLDGQLNALGTENNKITFDGGANSDFFQKASGDPFVNLDYCIVQNGESLGWPMAPINLRHSEVIDVNGRRANLLFPGTMYIEYNTFINWGGIGAWASTNEIHIRNNLFIGSGDGSLITYMYTQGFDVQYNAFIDIESVMFLTADSSHVTITAANNYWGTTNTTDIDSMIFDESDDININGAIEYLPILTEPHPNTPTLHLTANFTHSPTVSYAPALLTFDATSSSGIYSAITEYTWDFGDGNTTTTIVPIISHSYEEPNTYQITLTVTDEYGFQKSKETSITVLADNSPPTTIHDYSTTQWENSDFTITLSAIDSQSGVSDTYYRINQGTEQSVSVNGQPQITTESENNTLEFWSTDNSGNIETAQVISGIKLDKTGPSISEPVADPETHTVQEDQNVKVTVDVSDFVSGVDNVVLSYSTDGEETWRNIPMTLNSTSELWQATIPRQPIFTDVIYKIVAEDNAANIATDTGGYWLYMYQVIPEFPSQVLFVLFAFATLIAVVFKKLH